MFRKQFNLLFLCFSIFLITDAQTYSEKYEICSTPLKDLENLDSAYFALAEKRDSCLIGTLAPNFAVKSIDGREFELSKMKGHVVMLNFWYTLCEPCIEEMPELNKLVTLYSKKNVVFISFAPENADKLKNFILKHPFSFAIVSESEKIRAEQFKLLNAWPYSIIIDTEGKIAKMWVGSLGESTIPTCQKIIDNLLN